MAEHNNLWTIAEPLTERRATRIHFVERETAQLREYAQELETLLNFNKQAIQEALTSKIGCTAVNLSADTDASSHVSSRQLEFLISQNKQLLEDITLAFRNREVAQSRALLAEQIAEEAKRKRAEAQSELSEEVAVLNSLIERKENRIKSLQACIESLAQELAELRKDEGLLLLPLNHENLKYHMRLEELKHELAAASKELEKGKLQKEALVRLANDLETEGKKYRLLRRVPLYKQRRRAAIDEQRKSHFPDATVDSVHCDWSLAVDSVESVDAIGEAQFPDKVHIESRPRPSLPKLDLTKVAKRVDKGNLHLPKQPSPLPDTKTEELEHICRLRTEQIRHLRQRVVAQEEENTQCIAVLRTLEQRVKDMKISRKFQQIGLPVVNVKTRKVRRALSCIVDYILDEELKETELSASARVEELSASDKALSELSSLVVSEVPDNEVEEADSDLAEYLDRIPDFTE